MEKNTYFVFSDVHGEYDALRQSLEAAGYKSNNPRHKLVSLGDNFDRGEYSRQIYDFLCKEKAIWVKGNHEIMLEEALEKGMDGEFVLFNILHNGLDKTIESFGGMKIGPSTTPHEINHLIECSKYNTKYSNNGKSLLSTLKDLPYYFETKNYIFVHAGFEPDMPWQMSSQDVMTWDIEYSHLPIRSTNKTVVIGHHHAARVRAIAKEHGYQEIALGLPWYGNIDENAPVRIGNKIAIDPCSTLTHKVNVIVIEDEPNEEPITKKEEKTEEVIVGKTDGFRITDDNALFEAVNMAYTTPNLHDYRVYTTVNNDTYTIRM